MNGTGKLSGLLSAVVHPDGGITLDASGPAQPTRARAKRLFALALMLAITAVAAVPTASLPQAHGCGVHPDG